MSETKTYLMRPSSALAPGTQTGEAFALTEEILVWYLRVSAATGTGGLAVKIQVKDPVSGQWADLPGATASVTATGITRIVPTVGFVPDQDFRYSATATTDTYTFTLSCVGKSFN